MIDKQVTDILSLAILVILIGFSLFSGVSSLVQMDKEIQQYDVTYEDKTSTVKYTPSTKTYGTYDGTLTGEELIVMSQMLDVSQPYEKVIYFSEVTCQVCMANGITTTMAYEEIDKDDPKCKKCGHAITNCIKITNLFRDQLSEVKKSVEQYIGNDDPNKTSYDLVYDYEANAYVIRKIFKE